MITPKWLSCNPAMNETNMATGGGVDVYKQRNKRNLFSNKKEEIVSSRDEIECRGRSEIGNVLPACQDTSPERVYEIDLHASKLTKIENLEKFTKLRCLDASCNQVKIIKGLHKNLELKELKLYSNKIKNLEGLEKLRELCSVQLQDNCISKIGTGLQNLKKLKSLRVDCNEILTISVSEMSTCSKLTFLNVSSNKLGDISFVNCLPNLEEFYAAHNQLVKIPDLGRCKKLQELDVGYNRISSIAGIKNLPVLKILRLEHNVIKDFDVSGVVTALEELHVDNNELGNVKQLPLRFPAVEVLDVSTNRLDNIDAMCKSLSQCEMLRELNIAGNPCHNPVLLDHQNCMKALPHLEVFNGNALKRPQSSHGKTRPPMRPVSALQMVSTRHLEDQVSAAMQEQNSFETMISSKFDVVYDLLKRLPEKSSENSELNSASQPTLRVSNITSKSVHLGSQSNAILHQRDGPKPEESTRSHTQDSEKSLDSPRPSSRCSNRARLQDAIAFAEQNFDE